MPIQLHLYGIRCTLSPPRSGEGWIACGFLSDESCTQPPPSRIRYTLSPPRSGDGWVPFGFLSDESYTQPPPSRIRCTLSPPRSGEGWIACGFLSDESCTQPPPSRIRYTLSPPRSGDGWVPFGFLSDESYTQPPPSRIRYTLSPPCSGDGWIACGFSHTNGRLPPSPRLATSRPSCRDGAPRRTFRAFTRTGTHPFCQTRLTPSPSPTHHPTRDIPIYRHQNEKPMLACEHGSGFSSRLRSRVLHLCLKSQISDLKSLVFVSGLRSQVSGHRS